MQLPPKVHFAKVVVLSLILVAAKIFLHSAETLLHVNRGDRCNQKDE